ncbi:hypothetical protein G6F56_001175 [Rhizopus delemar]|nr:hypothetical protein G6F56_001175 [Rhizopus delemar]
MYSLEFAAQVSRLCMNEILSRGLNERKILCKSVPNSGLLMRILQEQDCKAKDLWNLDIHSVANLMQDTLWKSQRILPKKIWRKINYDTCTFEDLSSLMDKTGVLLLSDILDFLIQIKRHKTDNLMNAYRLGEAMGKVTLGPERCDPLMTEKASHFLTRLLIERARGFAMSQSEATTVKAKSYHRIIRGIQQRKFDWFSHVDIPPPSSPRLSTKPKLPSVNLPVVHISPKEWIHPIGIETKMRSAFDDFLPLLQKSVYKTHATKAHCSIQTSGKKGLLYSSSESNLTGKYNEKPSQIKSMMKKMIKITPLNKSLSALH